MIQFTNFINALKTTKNEHLIEAIIDGYLVIFEERNPKGDYRHWTKQIEKYKDDPNIYISFTVIPKLGINPLTNFNTPAGVYAYPLKEMWDKFDDPEFNTFADKRPYIQVLRGNPSVKHIDDLSKYDSKDFDDDMDILRKKYGNNKISRLVADARDYSYFKTPGGIFWYVTRSLGNKDSKKWYSILKKDLGYGYIADKEGLGMIHEAEPTQAFFLDNKAYEHIDMLKNTKRKMRQYNN